MINKTINCYAYGYTNVYYTFREQKKYFVIIWRGKGRGEILTLSEKYLISGNIVRRNKNRNSPSRNVQLDFGYVSIGRNKILTSPPLPNRLVICIYNFNILLSYTMKKLVACR